MYKTKFCSKYFNQKKEYFDEKNCILIEQIQKLNENEMKLRNALFYNI